jgi:DNA-binding XRE family transcriptional regulator
MTSSIKDFTYNGFGFPVKLMNVPFVEVRGEMVPNIDYKTVARQLLINLALKADRLTGNEIRFIRQYHEMTLEKFAETFRVSHPSVLNWEKKGDEQTKMSWSTEKDIRLFSLSNFKTTSGWEFYKRLTEMKNKLSKKYHPPKINVMEKELSFA